MFFASSPSEEAQRHEADAQLRRWVDDRSERGDSTERPDLTAPSWRSFAREPLHDRSMDAQVELYEARKGRIQDTCYQLRLLDPRWSMDEAWEHVQRAREDHPRCAIPFVSSVCPESESDRERLVCATSLLNAGYVSPWEIREAQRLARKTREVELLDDLVAVYGNRLPAWHDQGIAATSAEKAWGDIVAAHAPALQTRAVRFADELGVAYDRGVSAVLGVSACDVDDGFVYCTPR